MFFFFSSRRRHTRYWRDWSSDVCSSDLNLNVINNKISKYMEAPEKINFIDMKEEIFFNKTILDILRGEKREELVFKFEKNITKFIPLGRNIYKILINYIFGKYEDSKIGRASCRE